MEKVEMEVFVKKKAAEMEWWMERRKVGRRARRRVENTTEA